MTHSNPIEIKRDLYYSEMPICKQFRSQSASAETRIVVLSRALNRSRNYLLDR